MADCAARRSERISAQDEYKAKFPPGERFRPASALRIGACLAGLLVSACSVSMPLESMLPPDPVTTGSIGQISPLAKELDREDWRRARSAMAVALDPLGNGARATWENPESNRAGAFAPTTRPFVRDDRVCRRFSAEIWLTTGESRDVTGSACRFSEGEWRIDEIDGVSNEVSKRNS